jgi:hypothetical protein
MNSAHLPDLYFSFILNAFLDLWHWHGAANERNARETGMADISNQVTDRSGHFIISMLCEKPLQIGTIH